MQNIVLILTGGEVSEQLVTSVLKEYNFNTTIVVDRALIIADSCHLSMDYLVGDFDSVDLTLLEKYKNMMDENKVQTKLRMYNPVKDSTDTHIAIDLAISLNATKIILLGATGTRFDHVLSNVNLLMLPLNNGIEAIIYDNHNKIYLMDGMNHNVVKVSKGKQYGNYISLLPLTEEVTGVTLYGFKYPLTNKTLVIGDSLGVSNELVEDEGEIAITSGTLIVVESMD